MNNSNTKNNKTCIRTIGMLGNGLRSKTYSATVDTTAVAIKIRTQANSIVNNIEEEF